MDYILKNKGAWEEAFDNRHPNWGDGHYKRLLDEQLPFFDDAVKEQLQSMDFHGKRVAQFCCNNGREILSLMKLGAASGTGFDIAENIIGQARQTAEKAGITNCEFVSGDILEIPEAYHGCFDFIFFTIGAITWFQDLKPLMQKVAQCLAPGGVLLIHDFHPFMNMLPMPGEDGFDEKALDKISYSYFRTEPWIEDNGAGYMSQGCKRNIFTSFSHTMSAVINSISTAGLRIMRLDEYDYDVGLSEVYDGKGYPLSFLLTAEK